MNNEDTINALEKDLQQLASLKAENPEAYRELLLQINRTLKENNEIAKDIIALMK